MKFNGSDIIEPSPSFWPPCRAEKSLPAKSLSGLRLHCACNILRRGTPEVLPTLSLWRSTRADWRRDAHRQALGVLTSPGDVTVWSWRYPTLLGCRRQSNL